MRKPGQYRAYRKRERIDALATALEVTAETRARYSKVRDQALVLNGSLTALGYRLVRMSPKQTEGEIKRMEGAR
jgi:hypothetical protein